MTALARRIGARVEAMQSTKQERPSWVLTRQALETLVRL
jgi:hypothetical protein